MFTSSIVILGKFFILNLPLATGIATMGSAAGSILMPKVLGWLAEAWGWQGSFIYLAACSLLSVAFGALYIPAPKRSKRSKNFELFLKFRHLAATTADGYTFFYMK